MKNKKTILSAILITIALVFTVVDVNARGLTKSGNKITQEGQFDSVRFAFGQEVKNKAEIDGISFVAGQKLILEGKAPYGFFGGKTLTVSENIERDAFIAGEKITLTEKAIIGRDAFIAGKNVKIKSSIGRDLRLGANTADLRGAIITGDANISAERIKFDDNTRVLGKLTYPESSKVTGLNKENIKDIKVTKVTADKNKETTGTKIANAITNFIFSVVRAFIFATLLFWLIPNIEKKLKKEELKSKTIAKKSLIGLAALVIVPLVALIMLISSLLLPVSLTLLSLYVLTLYMGSLFVYYIIGNYLDKKFFKKKNIYLSLICGIFITKLVCLIPVLGAIISFIILLYGIGITLDYINSIRAKK